MIWDALLEFLIRLAFGLTVGLLITPSSLVPAGFYRVHLWVLLGMYTLAGLFATNSDLAGTSRTVVLTGCILTAVVCYVAAVIWLYERKSAGQVALVLVTLLGGALTYSMAVHSNPEQLFWGVSSAFSSSLLLGFVIAAMLLGHWYLNSPGMQLGPLHRLLSASYVSVWLRGAICAAGLFLWMKSGATGTTPFWATIGLRWLAGILGILVLLWMTRQTLRIPNTQSATGILYVAVIFSFLGELASQLVSVGVAYPL